MILAFFVISDPYHEGIKVFTFVSPVWISIFCDFSPYHIVIFIITFVEKYTNVITEKYNSKLFSQSWISFTTRNYYHMQCDFFSQLGFCFHNSVIKSQSANHFHLLVIFYHKPIFGFPESRNIHKILQQSQFKTVFHKQIQIKLNYLSFKHYCVPSILKFFLLHNLIGIWFSIIGHCSVSLIF